MEIDAGNWQEYAGPAVNPAQAARRLAALGVPTASRIPQCPMAAALQPMVTDWLAYPPPPPPAPPAWNTYQPGDDDTVFWPNEATTQPTAFLEVALCALTQGYVLAPGASRPPEARCRLATPGRR